MTEDLAHYPLRNVPRDTWTAAKRRAAHEGLSIRAVLLGLIRAYAEGRIKLQLDTPARKRPAEG